MARFLFCVYGAAGHIHPTLPVARALKQRGHEVALMTGPNYESVVRRLGLTYLMPRTWVATLDRVKPQPPARNPVASFLRMRATLKSVFFADGPAQAQDLQTVLSDWPADILVSSDMTFGVSLVAEKEERPWATHAALLTCPLPSRDLPPWGMAIPPPVTPGQKVRAYLLRRLVNYLTRPLSGGWDAIRAQEGLPARGWPLASYLLSPYLYTLPSSTIYDFPRSDLPPQVHYVGPCLWREDDSGEGWVTPFSNEKPLVYCTAGTVHNALSFVRTAVAAATGQSYNLFATLGKNNDPVELGPLPANVRVASYVPQHLVLPQAAAVLCNGGSGAVMAALVSGKPLIVVPQAADQPENALRCVQAGAAVVLPAHRCTPTTLCLAVNDVLSNSGYSHAAARLGQVLSASDGPSNAAGLLERLGNTGQPVKRTTGQTSNWDK